MPKDKSKSGRVPLKRKYAIEKKVKAFKKKAKKFAKSQEYRKKFRKGAHIPNSCPFKKEIIEAVQNMKNEKERNEHAAN